MAISSPLLEASIDGAHGVLLSIAGGSDLGLFEINEAAQLVADAAHADANIIFGAVIDDALGDEVRVTVIAAGFDGGTAEAPRPRPASALDRAWPRMRPPPQPTDARRRPSRDGPSAENGSGHGSDEPVYAAAAVREPRRIVPRLRRRPGRPRLSEVGAARHPRPVLRYEEDLAGARFALTDRLGGVSAEPYAEFNLARHVGDDAEAVEENRRRLARRIGLPADRVVFMNQVHGSDVVVLDHPDPARPPEADGLVTRTADLALAVLVADCVPVLLADARAGVVGVAHAGRRGLHAGIGAGRSRRYARSRGASDSRSGRSVGVRTLL